MVICLGRDAVLHIVQLMPLTLTVSCFSKIQIGFTFLVPAHPSSPGQSPESHEVAAAAVHTYTVGHKKMCLFILDHNSHISWWISTLCAPIKTVRNTLLGNYKICNITTTVSLHYLKKFKNTQNSMTMGDRFLLYVQSNPPFATFAESRLAFIVSSSC